MKPPSDIKRIVCLASSRMPGGRCIAGRELGADGQPGAWVRPVSSREHEGVAASESRYVDGGTPRLLDVVEVPILNAKPKDHQRENWLLDPKRSWLKVGSMDRSDLPKWVDTICTLWLNKSSTAVGRNNRVHTSEAKSLTSSLCLIKVNLTICVFDYFNRRRVQGRFRYKGTDYWLSVTDPDYEKDYKQRADGCYPLGKCLVTVSLAGADKDGYSYKLIAAIIKP